jgi:ComF family protein
MQTVVAAGRRLLEALLAGLLPADCTLCGAPLPWRQAGGVCLPCWSDLPWTPGLRSGRGPLRAVLWGGDYRDPLRRLIRGFKFEDMDDLGAVLGAELARRLGPLLAGGAFPPGIDMVVPVPLHWWRRWRRGYNQAEILAEPLAQALALPVRTDVLVRRRAGRRQLGLSRRDRLRALAGCYAARPGVRGRTVLVVDDVLTTGATLSACAAALRRAGAASVIGCVVARTTRN